MNKGKKQEEYMSAEQIEKTTATRFQKGSVPATAKPVGHERMQKGYVMIKAPGKRKMMRKHHWVWEEHYGKIPKGYNIQFRDGNRQNFDISNLYIISRSEQMKNENSLYARYPKEIQLAIQAKGALNRQINKRKKSES